MSGLGGGRRPAPRELGAPPPTRHHRSRQTKVFNREDRPPTSGDGGGKGSDQGELVLSLAHPVHRDGGSDMVNSKRARSGKPRIQPRGCTYIEPQGVSPGLRRVRKAVNASALSTRGRSRMSVIPHVRICAGGTQQWVSLPRPTVTSRESRNGDEPNNSGE